MDVDSIIRQVVGDKELPHTSMRTSDWLSWYRGEVMGFHNYRIYNGTNYLDMKRKSLQMAKKTCEDWANMLMNERCDIIIPEKKKLDLILDETNFRVKANEGVEKAFALGSGAFVMNVIDLKIGDKTGIINTDESKIKIDFVNALKMKPITIRDKRVTECAFISMNTDSTNLVIHVLDEKGNYVIHNYVLNKSGEVKNSYKFDTKSPMPWFFVIRPNISSNIITESVDEEIGISIFANSIDVLKAIDNKYDGFDLEYVLGRKRMFISSEAWSINKVDGSLVKTFDPYDALFYHLPENDEGKPLVTEKSDELRFDAYVKGINTELAYLSSKCGMGDNYYKFDGSSVATATQVISENSTLFRNIKKHELLLGQVLKQMTKSIIYASNAFTKIKFNDVKDSDITIQFDDSIIEDKETEMTRDRTNVIAGLMTKAEYRMRWFGEDEATAEKVIREECLYEYINRYLPALTGGVMTPEMFVNKVYGEKYPDKEKLIAYIVEYMNKPVEEDLGAFNE